MQTQLIQNFVTGNADPAHLKLYNCPHEQALPRTYYMCVLCVVTWRGLSDAAVQVPTSKILRSKIIVGYRLSNDKQSQHSVLIKQTCLIECLSKTQAQATYRDLGRGLCGHSVLANRQ
jgi:hypothetical protein